MRYSRGTATPGSPSPPTRLESVPLTRSRGGTATGGWSGAPATTGPAPSTRSPRGTATRGSRGFPNSAGIGPVKSFQPRYSDRRLVRRPSSPGDRPRQVVPTEVQRPEAGQAPPTTTGPAPSTRYSRGTAAPGSPGPPTRPESAPSACSRPTPAPAESHRLPKFRFRRRASSPRAAGMGPANPLPGSSSLVTLAGGVGRHPEPLAERRRRLPVRVVDPVRAASGVVERPEHRPGPRRRSPGRRLQRPSLPTRAQAASSGVDNLRRQRGPVMSGAILYQFRAAGGAVWGRRRRRQAAS